MLISHLTWVIPHIGVRWNGDPCISDPLLLYVLVGDDSLNQKETQPVFGPKSVF